MKTPKVLIGMVCNDMVHADFAYSLANLFQHTAAHGIGVGIHFCKSTLIDVGRNLCVEAMFENDCTHLCFIDSDMSFKPDVLVKLLAWHKPIVGCTYSTRRPPFTLVHRNLDGTRNLQMSSDPDWLGERIYRVESLGCGFMLIERDVFTENTRFSFEYRNGQLFTEDVLFCLNYFSRTGKRPYLDVQLSRESIRHCGMHYYSVEDTEK